MIRTIISLAEQDKRWLDSYSRSHHQSLAETVRQAIKTLRECSETETEKQILQQTSGLWKDRGVDGLNYAADLRDEW